MSTCGPTAVDIEDRSLKLGLGTVQFGLDYGIPRPGEICSVEEARAILDFASEHGIALLDTAAGYGDSERAVGECIGAHDRFKIVTKTPSLSDLGDTRTVERAIRDSLAKSLANLRRKKLYAVLVHHADDLLAMGGDNLWRALADAKRDGLVEKIGVSVYTSKHIEHVLMNFDADIVQAPLNVLDQRLVQDGSLGRLRERGVEIHARSVFLQGVLTTDVDDLPPYFEPIRGHLRAYGQEVLGAGLGLVDAAILFTRGIEELDYLVVGALSCPQLAETVRAFSAPNEAALDFENFAITDTSFIDPRTWQVT